MEALPPTHPPIDLSTPLYVQVVNTLTDLLPPPRDDTPEALHARNHAAIAKVAALLPVNANELDLAAQCIVARAQAEDLLRLLRQQAGEIGLAMRLNAQYALMMRTSLTVHARLMKVQALRHKREAIEGAADQDAWTQYIAERSMVAVLDADAQPRQAPSADQAQPPSPEPPSACNDQTTRQHASENETDSQAAGFETSLSEEPWNPGSTGPEETELRLLREAMALSHSGGLESPASGWNSPASTHHGYHEEAETAST